MFKLSIFCTITNPIERQDAYMEAIESYLAIADEVVVVDGGSIDGSYENIALSSAEIKNYIWPKEWEWEQLPRSLNVGLKACTGDWVIKADIDYIFHEKDRSELKRQLESLGDFPVANFYKWQFLLVDRYTLKARCPIAINRRMFPKIWFGKPTNGPSDWCQPIMTKKKHWKEDEVPEGILIDKNLCPDVTVPFYNYDFSFKSAEVIKEDFFRFAKAYYKATGNNWGYESEDHAWEFWMKMMKGRLTRPAEIIRLENHPKAIQDKIKNITPDQFGYAGFNF